MHTGHKTDRQPPQVKEWCNNMCDNSMIIRIIRQGRLEIICAIRCVIILVIRRSRLEIRHAIMCAIRRVIVHIFDETRIITHLIVRIISRWLRLITNIIAQSLVNQSRLYFLSYFQSN